MEGDNRILTDDDIIMIGIVSMWLGRKSESFYKDTGVKVIEFIDIMNKLID